MLQVTIKLVSNICVLDQDVTIRVAYLENCKHFCNKLWQAMRMYLHYAEDVAELPVDVPKPAPALLITFPDKWILACLYEFAKTYEENIRTCKFHLVTEAIRTFFYLQYCDVYLVIKYTEFSIPNPQSTYSNCTLIPLYTYNLLRNSSKKICKER